jgi:hypothetical protein
MAFVPAGSVFFDGDQILVAEYSVNTVSAYRVDASGNPIPASRRVMMTGLSGAVGSAIDPLTGDFVFSTFRQSHQVAIIRGFNAPSPIEPGLKDWVIYIDENNSGAREPWERSTRTAPDGSYEFVGLPPGSYIVREEPQTGWDQTFPALKPGSGSHVINVAAGQVVNGIDFLNEQGGVSKNSLNNEPALAHMRKVLGVKDTVTEETDGETHHVSVVPMVGFSPISHMGHQDLFKAMKNLPKGPRHIGISATSDAFSPEERKGILERQLGNKNASVHVVKGAGETLRRAYDSMPSTGRRVLHMVVGADRASFVEGLKRSLEAGKIKEMKDKKFDEILIHYPEDKERTHGMSGTKMRAAANSGDEEEFHRHLGPMFSRDESNKIMGKVKSGIDSGKIALKRK